MRTATCGTCQTEFEVPGTRGRKPNWCEPCNRERLAQLQRTRMADRRQSTPPRSVTCADCGTSLDWNGKGRPSVRCGPCRIVWNRTENKRRLKVWRDENIEHVHARDRRNYQRNAVAIRTRKLNEHYKSKYGITRAERDEMLAGQSGKCGICERVLKPAVNTGFLTRPHVDHCHTTGRVRGVLCSNCNTMIGLASEDSKVLLAAVEYLARE